MTAWTPHKSDQVLLTHSASRCAGTYCPVHNVSNHHMADWPQNYRGDLGCTERVCEHGIGHPDPDDIMWDSGVHGCDGCCTPPEENESMDRVSLLRRFTRWVRFMLSDESHFSNSDQFEEALSENETMKLEIQRLQDSLDIFSQAFLIQEEMIKEQKRGINMLKVAAGLTKKRGRPRKN